MKNSCNEFISMVSSLGNSWEKKQKTSLIPRELKQYLEKSINLAKKSELELTSHIYFSILILSEIRLERFIKT